VNNQPSNLSNTLGGYKRLLKPRVGYRMVVLSSTLISNLHAALRPLRLFTISLYIPFFGRESGFI